MGCLFSIDFVMFVIIVFSGLCKSTTKNVDSIITPVVSYLARISLDRLVST